MRKIYLLSIAISIWCGNTTIAQQAFLDQGILEKLDQSGENDLIPAILVLEDKVDITALKASFYANGIPVNKRAEQVMQHLKAKANETQPAIISMIENSGFAFDNVNQLWISNIIALEANPELIMALAHNKAIVQIDYNPAVYMLDAPMRGSGSTAKSEGGIEPGLAAIGAPEMWAMGYTGHGRIAMTFDTGVQPGHPAHSDRFLANLMPIAATWYPYDKQLPGDKPGSHGTHVTGTMLGLDHATNDTIGVAPQAYFIATDPIVENIANVQTLDNLMLGYQWALNPDGDESTSDDIPDVINNSWGRSNDIVDAEWQLCNDVVASTMDAVLAAGIANVFSAGNEGPDDATIGIPHNINTGLVNSFTVAAVSGTGSHNVANFSSRGPSLCGGEGSILIKPEVSAPGINVRSSVGENEYDLFSGTSMAAPHTSGAILLLKEAFPNVSGEELQLALYYTADDLGSPGEDNTYGMGIINLPNAFAYLAESHTPVPPLVLEHDLELSSIDSPNLDLACTNEITPVITITNLGTVETVGFTVNYDISGENETIFTSNIIIAPGASEQVTLSPISFTGGGLKELHIWIDEIENEYDLFNNHRTTRWEQLPQLDIGGTMLFSEDFTDGIDADIWTVSNPDGSITWDTISALQIDGNMGITAWLNHPDYLAIESQKNGLITPLFTNTGANESYNLTFDLYYRKRTNNNFTQDTLAIYFNDNCMGLQEVFRAGGSELWTNDDAQSDALPETTDEWTTISLDLPIISSESFYINFESINRRSNNLLIDNILISTALSTYDAVPTEFEMYPNPANQLVSIQPNSAQLATSIEIRDISGRSLLKQQETKSRYSIDIDTFASGVYLVTISYESGQKQTQKLIVE